MQSNTSTHHHYHYAPLPSEPTPRRRLARRILFHCLVSTLHRPAQPHKPQTHTHTQRARAAPDASWRAPGPWSRCAVAGSGLIGWPFQSDQASAPKLEAPPPPVFFRLHAVGLAPARGKFRRRWPYPALSCLVCPAWHWPLAAMVPSFSSSSSP